MISKRSFFFVLAIALGFFGAGRSVAHGQDSSQSSRQVPLGDVVRRQEAERQRGRKATHVLNDEDIHGHKRQISGDAAVTVIIPNVRITGYVEDVDTNRKPGSEPRLYVWIGSRSLDACYDVDCAKRVYIQELPQLPSMFGGTPRILFESETSIDGNPARIAHLEIKHDVKGKMFGEVAFIQTPAAATAASCIYKADAPDLEPVCDEFIGSLQVHMPERFIYVEHHY